MNTATTPAIDALRLRDRVAYKLLYQIVMPSVVRYVQRNSGSRADNLRIELVLCGPVEKPILFTRWRATKSRFLTTPQT